MNKRIHAYYSGSVQGVGFRFTAQRTASNLNLTGWVRNLGDGRVEVLCEGAAPVLKKFLDGMNDVFKKYISGTDVEWGASTGEFNVFDIRF